MSHISAQFYTTVALNNEFKMYVCMYMNIYHNIFLLVIICMCVIFLTQKIRSIIHICPYSMHAKNSILRSLYLFLLLFFLSFAELRADPSKAKKPHHRPKGFEAVDSL